MDYDFIWHDGGRAAAGYTGYAADCAARAIAIATGDRYEAVYDAITAMQGSSPRTGTQCAENLLEDRGWKQEECESLTELPTKLGVLILSMEGKRSGHLATIVSRTLYDTWDSVASGNLLLKSYWWHPQHANSINTSLPKLGVRCRVRARHDAEFQKVLNRIRKLDATANNAAATEGEVENALRAMQAMLFNHNLTREDIAEDSERGHEGFTNQRVAVNGNNACSWERTVPLYLTEEVFPLVNTYRSRTGKRTFYWFYGPVDDVEQCIELFRELLLTIATAAQTQYGTFRRGSGASYSEGFVNGLPRSSQQREPSAHDKSRADLVQIRAQQMARTARDWLREECKVTLKAGGSGYGRSSFDGAAHAKGMKDGSKHNLTNQPKRLTHRP